MKKTQRRVLSGGVLVLLVLLLSATGCSRAPDPWAEIPGTGPKVLVSFPPLYSLTKRVAGEHAQVLCLMTTQEPHDYHGEPDDSRKAKKADLIILNGLGLDDTIVTKIRKGSGNKKAKVLDLGAVLKDKHEDLLIHLHEDDDHDEPGHKQDDGHHHHGEYDPHAWLGVGQAKVMVKTIAAQLGETAPEHKAAYEKNAAALLQQLDELQQQGKTKLADKANKRIVATHDSMRYFAKSFGLKVVDNLMPQPGIKPDVKKVQELVKLCIDTEAPVRVITVEPQYTNQAAENLLHQIDLELKKKQRQADLPKLVTFDTMETSPEEAVPDDFYLTTMRKNIEELAEALK